MNTKKALVALVAAAALGLSACTNTPIVNQNTAIENQAMGNDTIDDDNSIMENKDTTTNTATATDDSMMKKDDDDTADKNDDAMMKKESMAKEFSMTSFYEMKDGKAAPQFSVKNLTVKKGDVVRIKITNTKGMHDFNLDEFNIHKATPLNEEVVIEFTADKAGDFVYYCSMPGHRAAGHWGTLHVK